MKVKLQDYDEFTVIYTLEDTPIKIRLDQLKEGVYYMYFPAFKESNFNYDLAIVRDDLLTFGDTWSYWIKHDGKEEVEELISKAMSSDINRRKLVDYIFDKELDLL